MPETALIVPENLSHNVSARLAQAKNTLSDLATMYLLTNAAGQSQATQDAKQRDLQRFLTFYQTLYGHDRPDEWFVSVTKAFLTHLQRERLAQASLVRIYATVRHFARWLHRQFPALFPLGSPTEGVKPPAEPPADWKGLTRRDELRLLHAAQALRARHGTGTDQGLRNYTLFAVLLGSGLRVSEVLNLEKDQYTGKGFTRVRAKGGVVRDVVPMHRDARQVLEEWLEQRKDDSPALFITRTGRKLSRREAAAIIRRIATQANAHLPKEEQINVSPHVLRHTFLRKLAETKGVHYAREASGHQSDRYIWRYVKPDQQTLADAIDELGDRNFKRCFSMPLPVAARRLEPQERQRAAGGGRRCGFFDMARTQRIRHIPADPHQNDLFGEMGAFETDRHRRLPHDAPLLTGEDHTSNRLK